MTRVCLVVLMLYVHFRPKKFTLKAYKRFYFVCTDLQLRLYKNQVDAYSGGPPVHIIPLRDCEVTPDLNLSQRKYGIKLEVPSAEGMTEMWIRCDNVSIRFELIFGWLRMVFSILFGFFFFNY